MGNTPNQEREPPLHDSEQLWVKDMQHLANGDGIGATVGCPGFGGSLEKRYGGAVAGCRTCPTWSCVST